MTLQKKVNGEFEEDAVERVAKRSGSSWSGRNLYERVNGEWVTIYESVAIPDSVANQNNWAFSEGSGTNVEDDVGNLDADFSGLAWGDGAGRDGFYGILDGTDDYGDLGSDSRSELSHFVNDGVGALGGWINPDSLSSDVNTIIGTELTSSSRSLNLAVNDGEGQFQFTGGTSTFQSIYGGTISTGDWVSIVGTADGDDMHLYLDGVQVASGDITDLSSGDLDYDVSIGRETGSNARYWDGALDDLWVSDTHVTESDINDWIDATQDNYE